MALSDTLAGLSGVLEDIGDFAKSSIDTWKDIYSSVKGSDNGSNSSGSTAGQSTYNPNLAWSDFAFQPNYYLLFGGLALLIVALFLMRK